MRIQALHKPHTTISRATDGKGAPHAEATHAAVAVNLVVPGCCDVWGTWSPLQVVNLLFAPIDIVLMPVYIKLGLTLLGGGDHFSFDGVIQV